MAARMRRDFEAVDRSEAAEAAAKAMAEAREWARAAAEAEEGREQYRGVRKVPSGKFAAEIRAPETRKQVWLGTYGAALVAACAYDIAARTMHADKAKPNFKYPPPPGLVFAVSDAPRRCGHSYHAPPAPPAPAPATNEPAAFQAYPVPHVPRTARARIVLPAPAPAQDREIAVVRSTIPPESFSIQATAAASYRVYDPVNHVAPPMHMVAPASSVKTSFSFTMDPKERDSASSSTARRRLMLKKPKVIATPTTTTTTTTPNPSTSEDCEVTGDNFTGVPVPWFFKLPPNARMPFDIDGEL